MKPVASILALAIALASNFAYASPETDGKDNVKIEKKEETKKEPSKETKKPSKHHARTVQKGRAHSDKPSGMVAASMRTPAATKEKDAKPAKTKKAEKKGDQKHPAPSGEIAKHNAAVVAAAHPAIESDQGARDHNVEATLDTDHAEPSLPALPPPTLQASPSTRLKQVSAHEKIADAKLEKSDKPAKGEKTDKAEKPEKSDKQKHAPKPPCMHPSVEILRGAEIDSFPLTTCDGAPTTQSIDRMSIMLRPGSIAKPAAEPSADAKRASHVKPGEIAPGIKKIDPGLVTRLEKVLDHFKTDSHTPKIAIVSGYRPTSTGSFHALGRAIDFRLEGIDNTKLVDFCKTLPDTGCGYYPNSSFIHLDVRDAGTGHAAWIDASGPGEAPRYVPTWPPADNREASDMKKQDVPEKIPGDEVPVQEDQHPDAPATAH